MLFVRKQKRRRMSIQTAWAVNPHNLSDADLLSCIETLRDVHASGHNNFPVELTLLISIATAEKNSRAAARLTRAAISVAFVGLLVAIIGIWQ